MPTDVSRPTRRVRAVPRGLAAVLALVTVAAATVALGLGAPVSAQAVPEPDADPFYDPPAGHESQAPGALLRTRPVNVTGLGIPIPVRSTQMLVRSCGPGR